MKRFTILLLGWGLCVGLVPQDTAAPRYVLRQLAGRWEGTAANGQQVFEHWVLRGGKLDCRSGYLDKGQEVVTEEARILELNGRTMYLAFPTGGHPTVFVLHPDSSSVSRWVFLNPHHDDPQRLVYQFDSRKQIRTWALPLTGEGPAVVLSRQKGG